MYIHKSYQDMSLVRSIAAKTPYLNLNLFKNFAVTNPIRRRTGLQVKTELSGGIKVQLLPNRVTNKHFPSDSDIIYKQLTRRSKAITMPKNKKAAVSSDSDSDSGPDDRTPVKKAKVEEKSSGSSKSKASGSSGDEVKLQLDKNRFITVREFKSKVYIDIRETYMDNNGEQKPGKKGIALTPAQWEKLKKLTPDIDDAIKSF